MKIKLTFTEELLGTKAASQELFDAYIASKAPDADKRAEESAAHKASEDVMREAEEISSTVFDRQAGQIGLWDYQFKGFFKEACGALRRADCWAGEGKPKSVELKAYKTVIDGLVFVKPRFVPLVLPDGAQVGRCDRPCQCSTAQGPRVTLKRSETAPAGTTCEIEIITLNTKLVELIEEWLDYGAFVGMGSWRGGSKGRFTWAKA